jgi:hypothetical protein
MGATTPISMMVTIRTRRTLTSARNSLGSSTEEDSLYLEPSIIKNALYLSFSLSCPIETDLKHSAH